MSFFDLDIAKARGIIDSYVDSVLKKNPDLKVLAKKRDKKALQLRLVGLFNKCEREEYVEHVLFSTAELDQAGKPVFEDGKQVFKPAVREYIAKRFVSLGMPDEHATEYAKLAVFMLVKLVLHRRLDAETLVNMCKHKVQDPSQLGTLLKLFERENILRTERGIYVTKYSLTPEQEFELDLRQANMPFVCKPKKILKYFSDGKWKLGSSTYKDIKRSVWTKEADVHGDVPVDHLNIQNSIAYGINYSYFFKYGQNHICLPDRKPTDDDTTYNNKVRLAFIVHWRKYFTVSLFHKLGIKKLWILNVYDYRGRNYPISWLFNPQGTDADKALLCFQPQRITSTGKYWLAISITNCWGIKYTYNGSTRSLDKFEPDVAFKLYQDYIEPLMVLPKDEAIVKFAELCDGKLYPEFGKADQAHCLFSQLYNMWHIYASEQAGKIGYVWVITHWDATASGYQIQALWSGDRKLSEMVNLIYRGDISDFYSADYQELLKLGIPQSNYSRNDLKHYCYIPVVYGSKAGPRELFTDSRHLKIFWKHFLEYKAIGLSQALVKLFDPSWTRYSWKYPDCFTVLHILKEKQVTPIKYGESILNLYNEVEGNISYTLEIGPNLTHGTDGFIMREATRTCSYSPKHIAWVKKLIDHKEWWKTADDSNDSVRYMKELLERASKSGYVSQVILQSVTPENISLIPEGMLDWLISELTQDSFEISEIHDSFGICPNYFPQLSDFARKVYYHLARSSMLSAMVSDLKGVPVTFKRNSQEYCEEILRSKWIIR